MTGIVSLLAKSFSRRSGLWYTLYHLPDIDAILRICRNPPNRRAASSAGKYESRLMLARQLVQGIRPPQYILEPPFRGIVFDLDGEIPRREPFASIFGLRKFQSDCLFLSKFVLPTNACHSVARDMVFSNWPEKAFWRKLLREIRSSRMH